MLLCLPTEVIRDGIFKYLTARESCAVRATCWFLRRVVDSVPRFRLHYTFYPHPELVDLSDLVCGLRDETVCDVLYEYGYTGEGRIFARDKRTGRRLIINDFYGRGFRSSHFLELVENLENDTEFGFRWQFIEFPTLPDRERYMVPIRSCRHTIHRGCMIMISWEPRKRIRLLGGP